MAFQEEEGTQISKYNDAVFSISRLHQMWLNCNSYIRRGNFKSWKYELDMVWLELMPDVLRQKPKQKREATINKNETYKIKISEAKSRTQMFNRLMERHEFLRQVQDNAGKAGIYRDEDEEGFE